MDKAILWNLAYFWIFRYVVQFISLLFKPSEFCFLLQQLILSIIQMLLISEQAQASPMVKSLTSVFPPFQLFW